MPTPNNLLRRTRPARRLSVAHNYLVQAGGLSGVVQRIERLGKGQHLIITKILESVLALFGVSSPAASDRNLGG
jgi:hypothetical protein